MTRRWRSARPSPRSTPGSRCVATALHSCVRRRLTAEKQELELSLRSGGDAVQDIKGKSWQELYLITKCTADRTARIEASRNDLRRQVADIDARIAAEEELQVRLAEGGSKAAAEAARLKEERQQLEQSVEQCGVDKQTKDNQIVALKEEIAHQEEIINKLSKEKRQKGEERQKTEENLQVILKVY